MSGMQCTSQKGATCERASSNHQAQPSSAIAVGNRVEFAVRKAEPAAVIVPIVIAATPFHLTTDQRPHAKANHRSDSRATAATGGSSDCSARQAADQRAPGGAAARSRVRQRCGNDHCDTHAKQTSQAHRNSPVLFVSNQIGPTRLHTMAPFEHQHEQALSDSCREAKQQFDFFP
jgi:hypothetical protein